MWIGMEMGWVYGIERFRAYEEEAREVHEAERGSVLR
jgi:hypothetical protein